MSLLNTLSFVANHPLNKHRKVKSIVDFIKWQIGSRLVKNPIIYNWINNAKFIVKTGETGLTGNIYTGLHEFPDMAYLLHVMREQDLFVDVGANVGSYTILACSVVGARGYAFEPVPNTFKRLVDNIHINYLDNKVQCVNKCLGAEIGNVIFTNSYDTTNHALSSGEHMCDTIDIEMTTLDASLGNASPTLMKIDVEGYETNVLKGGKETLQKEDLHSVIMELNSSGQRYGFNESEIMNTMLGYGFKAYSYDPFKRHLIELSGKNLDEGNTIFIRDKSLVLERLKNAPTFVVNSVSF